MNIDLSGTGLPVGFGFGFGFIALIALALTAVVHVACMIQVGSDASRIEHERGGTELVGATIWMIAALLGGMLTLGLYWAMHHSTLRPRATSGGNGQDAEADPTA